MSSESAAAVSMRDVGTEMTPMASKEQSRSGTPAGAATPSLSPLCSLPSSPRAPRARRRRRRSGAPDQDAPRDRRARAAAGQDEHRVVGQQARRRGAPPRLAGEETETSLRRRRRRGQEAGVRGARHGVAGDAQVQARVEV